MAKASKRKSYGKMINDTNMRKRQMRRRPRDDQPNVGEEHD